MNGLEKRENNDGIKNNSHIKHSIEGLGIKTKDKVVLIILLGLFYTAAMNSIGGEKEAIFEQEKEGVE